MEKGWLLSPVFLNMALKGQTNAIKQANTIRGMQIKRKKQTSLHLKTIYPNVENVKEATKSLELIKPTDQCLRTHKLNQLYSHGLAMNRHQK